MLVFGHWRDRSRGIAVRGWLEAVVSLGNVPAIVSAFFNEIDFLPLVLPDITDPEIVIRAIERKTPGISESVRPDFRAYTIGRINKRIVGRDAVVQAVFGVVDIYSNDGAQQGCWVLAVAIGIEPTTAVAESDVEVAVGAEHDSTTVVVGVRLVDLENDVFGSEVGCVWIGGDGKPTYDRSARFCCGVVNVEVAVFRVIGVEGQAEEPFLVAIATYLG